VVLTGLIWLRIGTSGGPSWTWYQTFRFYKMLERSRVPERLEASHNGLNSMELVQCVPLDGSPRKCWCTKRTKVQYICMSYL
jgi:hypothetical protein